MGGMMKRFEQFSDRTVNLENIKNSDRLAEFGVTCRYLPDPPEDYDEFEFGTDYKGKHDIGIMVAIELMQIKRLMFGFIDPDNPDIIRPMGDALDGFLNQKADTLLDFFDFITQ